MRAFAGNDWAQGDGSCDTCVTVVLVTECRCKCDGDAQDRREECESNNACDMGGRKARVDVSHSGSRSSLCNLAAPQARPRHCQAAGRASPPAT